MANPSANQVKIDLSGNLCLNELDCEVHSFEGFNERNTQILGNGLKPYYQHIDETDEQVIYDRNEDKWTVKDDVVYKNNEQKLFAKYGAVKAVKAQKEKIDVNFSIKKERVIRLYQTGGLFPGQYISYVKDDEEKLNIFVDDVWQVRYSCQFMDVVNIDLTPQLAMIRSVIKNSLTTDINFSFIKLAGLDFNLDNIPPTYTISINEVIDIKKFSANLCHVFVSGAKRNLIIFEILTETKNFIYGVLLDANNDYEEHYELTGISQNNYRLNPLVCENDGDVLNPEFFKYNSSAILSNTVIAKIGNNCEWSAGTLTNITDKDFTSFRNGSTSNNFAPGGQVVCEEDTLCGLRAFHVIQGLTVSTGDDGIPLVYTKIANYEAYPLISQIYKYEQVSYTYRDAEAIYIETGGKKLSSTTFKKVVDYVKNIEKFQKLIKNSVYSSENWNVLRGCLNIKIKNQYGFNYLINFNGDKHSVTGISTYGTLLTRWGSIDTSSKPIISTGDSGIGNMCQYHTENNTDFALTIGYHIPLKIKYVLNRYILTNLIQPDTYEIKRMNAYDVKKDLSFDYASDWNNRISINNMKIGNSQSETSSVFVSFTSGDNQIFSIQNEENGRSASFAPLYGYIVYDNTQFNADDELINNLIDKSDKFIQGMDFYYTFEESTNPFYQYTIWPFWRIIHKSILKDVMYTVCVDNNMYLSPDLLSDYKQLCNNDWVITTDENSYILTKYDFENMLLYQIGTLIQDIDDIFSIQGQFYAIKNNTLFLVTISDGAITSNTIIYYLQDLQFIGATLQYALFYSPKQKSVYVFSGDRRLELLGPANEIDHVNTYFYDNSQNTIFIGCDKFILCYKDNYFWKIHIPEVKQFYFTDRGIEFIADDKIGLIHNYYHADDKAEMSVIPVTLETAFYGFGENRIGIIDCWNIRLFSKDKLSGNVKLKVTSLTDKGTVGEEATIAIKESDWDKITKTYLLRFQPRLQRGIGLSLAIVSDFELYELQVSATPDSALQITERRVI